jgi:predicted Zn-dependent peptidase
MIEATPLTDFRFVKTTLGNGLDVIFRHQSQLPIVAINLWYHVGSKNEERHSRGFTHLFEHLMFEGSAHYPGDFFKHLQPLGANINGSTSSDRTNYFVDLPTAHAQRAIAMESDRMAHLLGALDDSKLNIQKDVVKNEYRQNYANRPYGMVWPLVAETLYPPQHPYSWMTIGVMEDLDRATMADVSAFFRRFYFPSNASLAIVGDLDEEKALALAERYFEPIPGGSRAPRPWVPEGTFKNTAELVLHDRVELDRLYLIWPTAPHFHRDDAPLLVLGDVLARGRSSRLHHKLVIDQQIAQDVTAYQSGRELDGSFGIIVTLRPSQSISQVKSLVEAEIAAIVAHGVTDDELRRVQTIRTASFLFALEHMGGFGGVADRLNAYNVFRGDPSLITADVRRFQSVAAQELTEVAARYLDGRPRVSLSVVGRKKAGGQAALDRAAGLATPEPTPYRPPLPEIIPLACGIPLWVFPRRDLPTVAGSIIIPVGAGIQTPAQAGLAQLTAVMLDEGTRSHSAEAIALAVESMGGAIDASCGWDGSYVSFRCLKAHLPSILDLTVDILLNPTFPESEWQRTRGQTLAALKAERDSAESRAYRSLLSALYASDHPYRFPLVGTEASVAGFTPADLAGFHARNLVSAAATIVVAGDVDPRALADAFNERLPSLKNPNAPVVAAEPPVRGSRKRLLLIDRPGAPQAVVRAGHLGVARSVPRFEHVMVLNQILGGQFSSRLNAKLREERGFTYGVRSHFDFRNQPGPFSITTSVQADRLAEALGDIHNELEAIVGGRPPTQLELDNARRALVEGQARHFETPSALVNRFANLVVHGLPVDHEAGLADRLRAIELDSLTAQAREHFHPDCLVAIVVADAADVIDDLKKLDWAAVEPIDG